MRQAVHAHHALEDHAIGFGGAHGNRDRGRSHQYQMIGHTQSQGRIGGWRGVDHHHGILPDGGIDQRVKRSGGIPVNTQHLACGHIIQKAAQYIHRTDFLRNHAQALQGRVLRPVAQVRLRAETQHHRQIIRGGSHTHQQGWVAALRSQVRQAGGDGGLADPACAVPDGDNARRHRSMPVPACHCAPCAGAIG